VSQAQTSSPKPVDTVVDEGQSEAFIPYPPTGKNLEHVPIHVRPEVYYYQARMAFLPNAIKLYLHTPWIAEHLFRFNNALMRDERNGLDEHLKYRLSLVASQTNGCSYCTAHHACTLERRWGYDDGQIAGVLDPNAPLDEREAVAMEFVRKASLDSTAVPDELRARLAAHFSPQEVMEIVLVVGFWKMYNTMHNAMNLPIEDPVQGYTEWVNYGKNS
jgi:uncharacterized peroxidase-related enzyme